MRAFLARQLNSRQKAKLKSVARVLPQKVIIWCAKSRLLSWLHSMLSGRYNREQYAVISGRAQYLMRQQQVAVSSDPMLRRNIHRLEKGLIMKPRKVPFAIDYIDETVSVFQRQWIASEHPTTELQWAADVLREYFSVCGAASPALSKLADTFQGTLASTTHTTCPDVEKVPYAYAELPALSMSFDEYLVLCRRRRSVRWFLPKSVPKTLLEQAVDAASLAPSACNRQPFRFFYTLDAEKAASIASLAVGTTGFAGQIPALLVVIGDLSQFEENRDRHVIYIDASLAAMQLMLALDRLGLASCPINWPDIESAEKNMDAKLRLAPWERPVMLIAIGYADPTGGVAFSQKKSAQQLLVEI